MRLSLRFGAAAFSAATLVAFLMWAGNDSKRPAKRGDSAAILKPGAPVETQNASVAVSAPTGAKARAPNGGEMSTAELYLRQLEALSRSDKAAALALAQNPESEFPERGVFAEAREALSITLLVDLGRMTEARHEVRRFIQSHPQSRYRPLVQGMTGIHPRPTRPQTL